MSFADAMDKYGKQFVIGDTEALTTETKFWNATTKQFGGFADCSKFITRPTCHAPEAIYTFDQYAEWLRDLKTL